VTPLGPDPAALPFVGGTIPIHVNRDAMLTYADF
jgi:hypothetical protein